jgi:predicted nucleic acid-binding Zn finger protein
MLSAAAISTTLASRLAVPFCHQLHLVGEAPSNEAMTSCALPLSKQLEALFFINGKVFSAATGIAFHMTEPIYRLVVPLRATASAESSSSQQSDVNLDAALGTPLSGAGHVGMLASHRILRTPGRYVYQVGSHVVFEPPTSLCSCAAFKFQVVNKHETRSCKHIVALQMALRLDAELHAGADEPTASGLHSNAAAEDCDAFNAMPPQQRRPGRPRWTNIRERTILPEEFVALVSSPHY